MQCLPAHYGLVRVTAMSFSDKKKGYCTENGSAFPFYFSVVFESLMAHSQIIMIICDKEIEWKKKKKVKDQQRNMIC